MTKVRCPEQEARIPLRLLALAALLLVEATVLTKRFDVGALTAADATWARLLAHSRILLPCGIAVFTGVLLFGREHLAQALRSAGKIEPKRWVAWLAAHGIALVLFHAATGVLFEQPEHAGAAWLITWLVSGLVCVGSLILIALPMDALWQLLRQGGGAALLGTTVGVLAFLVGQQTESGFWHVLGGLTLGTVHAILGLVTRTTPLDAEAGITGTERFQVEIDVGCSGYEGIGLVWIFLSIYLWSAQQRLRFPAALLLLPLGTVAVWTANLVRIVALILIGDLGAPSLAVGAFHTRMGWVLFCSISLALAAFAERSAWLRRDTPAHERLRSREAFGYVAPLLAILGFQLLGGSFVSDGDIVRATSMLLGLAVLLHFHRSTPLLRPSFSWPAVAVGVAVFVLWVSMGADSLGVSAAGPTSAAVLSSFGWASAVASLGSVLVVPVSEELAFRGYLARRLNHSSFERVRFSNLTPFALVASSLFFGLAHEHTLAASAAGLAYVLLVRRSGNLFHAVLAHAVTNGLLLLYRSIA